MLGSRFEETAAEEGGIVGDVVGERGVCIDVVAEEEVDGGARVCLRCVRRFGILKCVCIFGSIVSWSCLLLWSGERWCGAVSCTERPGLC